MMDIIIIPLAFLLFMLMGSLFMCGWYVITRKGKIFGFWSQWWEGKKGDAYTKPEWLVLPLSGCVYCFSSIYGSLFFWLVGKSLLNIMGVDIFLSVNVITLWIVFCISTSALNGVLIKKVL